MSPRNPGHHPPTPMVPAAAETAAAPGVVGTEVGLQPKNHYDRHRVICTCDDRLQASRLSGHTWNVINNQDDSEVYLRECRNPEHFIDEQSNATKHWFARKRVVKDRQGVITACDSSQVA